MDSHVDHSYDDLGSGLNKKSIGYYICGIIFLDLGIAMSCVDHKHLNHNLVFFVML